MGQKTHKLDCRRMEIVTYLSIKDAKFYFDEPREKLSSRSLCGRTRQSRGSQRVS
jgi:hypothetical protein